MLGAPAAHCRPLVFWMSDTHDGVRVDRSSLLQRLGHRVIDASYKGPHTILGVEGLEVLVNADAAILPLEDRAPLIQRHTYAGWPVAEGAIRGMFEFYRASAWRRELVQHVDAFACTFPPSFCEAYLPYNRTIVWMPGHRYAFGRCSRAAWDVLSTHLRKAANDSFAAARGGALHVVAAGTVFDAQYVNYFTGLTPVVLDMSALGYAPRFAEGGLAHTMKRPEILVGPLHLGNFKQVAWFFTKDYRERSKFKFATASGLYGHYRLADLMQHRAMVIMPYSVASIGLNEVHALGLPIFAPSAALMARSRDLGWDVQISNSPHYCRAGTEGGVPPQHPDARHPYSPEDESEAARRYWFGFADQAVLPNVTTFESQDDLEAKLAAADFASIHAAMNAANRRRAAALAARWDSVFARVEASGGAARRVPASYEEGMRALWDEERASVLDGDAVPPHAYGYPTEYQRSNAARTQEKVRAPLPAAATRGYVGAGLSRWPGVPPREGADAPDDGFWRRLRTAGPHIKDPGPRPGPAAGPGAGGSAAGPATRKPGPRRGRRGGPRGG